MNDYERVARAIAFVSTQADHHPTLDEIAAHIHLSPYHFQRLFSRWAGITPKRFLQAITVERAKPLLEQGKALLDVSETLGLSSSSRLHDHFVSLEAMTPGEFKARGAGLRIEYAEHETPFGRAFVALTTRGICKLSFLTPATVNELLALKMQWADATFVHTEERTAPVIQQIFQVPTPSDAPLSLLVRGTNFQINVWRALLRIPSGRRCSYSDVARRIGKPSAVRAVGQAVGANPVAFLIPCHRVIQQNGGLGGYHWGETRKLAIHIWENARTASSPPQA